MLEESGQLTVDPFGVQCREALRQEVQQIGVRHQGPRPLTHGADQRVVAHRLLLTAAAQIQPAVPQEAQVVEDDVHAPAYGGLGEPGQYPAAQPSPVEPDGDLAGAGLRLGRGTEPGGADAREQAERRRARAARRAYRVRVRAALRVRLRPSAVAPSSLVRPARLWAREPLATRTAWPSRGSAASRRAPVTGWAASTVGRTAPRGRLAMRTSTGSRTSNAGDAWCASDSGATCVLLAVVRESGAGRARPARKSPEGIFVRQQQMGQRVPIA